MCLPCCSLANRLFKDEYKTKSFMHALDDDDMEEEKDIKVLIFILDYFIKSIYSLLNFIIDRIGTSS